MQIKPITDERLAELELAIGRPLSFGEAADAVRALCELRERRDADLIHGNPLAPKPQGVLDGKTGKWIKDGS